MGVRNHKTGVQIEQLQQVVQPKLENSQSIIALREPRRVSWYLLPSHCVRLTQRMHPLLGLHKGIQLHTQYDWTTGVLDIENEWRKFRVVPRSHPLRPPVLCFVFRVGNRRAFRQPGEGGIISIVWWNLHPIIFGVDQHKRNLGGVLLPPLTPFLYFGRLGSFQLGTPESSAEQHNTSRSRFRRHDRHPSSCDQSNHIRKSGEGCTIGGASHMTKPPSAEQKQAVIDELTSSHVSC